MRWLLIFLFACSIIKAESIYIAAANSGTADGSSCANALVYTWFNTSGNWGVGAGKISPGDTVILCGTFTGTAGQSLLIFQGSGTAGNLIRLACDTGALITSPQWAGGSSAPISAGSKSYLDLDGSGCTIQNTANGSGLANNAYSTGIFASGSNILIRNWTISNICQHTSVTDHTGCVTSGNLPAAIMTSGPGITVSGNTIHDSAYGIYHNAGTTDTGLVISGNTIDRCNQHIAVGVASSGQAIAGSVISGNSLTNAVNWDDGATNTFHHNAIFVFQGSGGSISNTSVFNNSIGGDFGVNDTSHIFFDPNGGTITGTLVYNNLMINGSATNGPANGFITGLGTSGGAAYNNTIHCNGVGYAAIKLAYATASLKNNIISNCRRGISVDAASTLASSDYNLFYGLTAVSPMVYTSTNYASIAAWQSGTGLDLHSVTGDPLLAASGVILPASSAIGTGINLTSLGVSTLNVDRAGVSRPSSTAWDIGAYQYIAPSRQTGSMSGTIH